MAKQIHEDQDFRDRIRLKCENDWSIKLTEDQITMGIMEQEEQKLSIWHNQLWPNKRTYKDKDDGYKWKSRVSWDKTIDGYRAIAHRNGFAGAEPTKFMEDSDGKLVMATVTVYRIGSDGQRYPYVGEARWEEFAPRNKEGNINCTGQWKTAPYNMLSVAAQRQALRLAFQEFDYQSDEVIEDSDVDDYEEPELEPERGEPTETDSPAPESTDAPEPSSETAPEPHDSAPKGKHVGIPSEGFLAGKMYNDEERIVLAFEKGGNWVLALDSGVAVRVESSGHESTRRDRQDDNPGGREWNAGDAYYDGAKIEKIAPTKKDPQVLWVGLDSGFKVRLDRWGKETKRKERKAAEEPKKPVEAEAAGTADSGQTGPTLDEVRAMTEKEKVRQVCIPLMVRYCKDANGGVKISLKAAYERFSGEVMQKGAKMDLTQYKVLFECLGEALAAHARGEKYPVEAANAVGK